MIDALRHREEDGSMTRDGNGMKKALKKVHEKFDSRQKKRKVI